MDTFRTPCQQPHLVQRKTSPCLWALPQGEAFAILLWAWGSGVLDMASSCQQYTLTKDLIHQGLSLLPTVIQSRASICKLCMYHKDDVLKLGCRHLGWGTVWRYHSYAYYIVSFRFFSWVPEFLSFPLLLEVYTQHDSLRGPCSTVTGSQGPSAAWVLAVQIHARPCPLGTFRTASMRPHQSVSETLALFACVWHKIHYSGSSSLHNPTSI